ncbi:hypothetical protein QVD17_07644 [Tagetes erecta]|uniref:Uncharacterized protein n=1 Tax=Tagetes erecta TaxID=13708 RepID=A0AAD8LNT0_TARER|nr:hypothetical protein QVD17_07644 [Tagetes erecta]
MNSVKRWLHGFRKINFAPDAAQIGWINSYGTDQQWASHYMLSESKKGKENPIATSLSHEEAYKKRLADSLDMNRTRILVFRNKPQTPSETVSTDCSSICHSEMVKSRRYISQTSERTLDGSDLVDDYYLNLLNSGSTNVLAIALANTVYLWVATNGNTSELAIVDVDIGPLTSVKWASAYIREVCVPDEYHLQTLETLLGACPRLQVEVLFELIKRLFKDLEGDSEDEVQHLHISFRSSKLPLGLFPLLI